MEKSMAMDVEKYMADRRNIEWEWRDVMCSCDTGITPSIEQIGKGVKNSICLRCNKRLRWAFLKCRECKSTYDFLFRHHATASGQWANHKSICWNCLVEEDPAEPGDNPPEYTGPPKSAQFTDMGDFAIEF